MWEIFDTMAPRFCRQRQAAIEARLTAIEDTQAANGGLLRRMINILTDVQGKITMVDKNLDNIEADLPALLAGVSSAVATIQDLSTQLKALPADDPRAAEIDGKIKAASQSITDAISALSPAPAAPPAPATPAAPASDVPAPAPTPASPTT